MTIVEEVIPEDVARRRDADTAADIVVICRTFTGREIDSAMIGELETAVAKVSRSQPLFRRIEDVPGAYSVEVHTKHRSTIVVACTPTGMSSIARIPPPSPPVPGTYY